MDPSEPRATHPQFLDVRGVRTAYRRAGAGAPMLYLHGAGLTRRWLPIHEELSAEFTVFVPEHPGFGDTTRPVWYRSVDDMALHYADLLDAFDLARVHVVGHSFGGRLAASFAALFPERVISLALLAPAPLEPGGEAAPPPWSLNDDLDIDDLMFNGRAQAYPEYLDADDEGGNVDADEDPHADPAQFRLDADPALYRRLARISSPSVVIAPEEDRLIPRTFFTQWRSYLPNSSMQVISGTDGPTGHLFIVQEPTAVADAITQFAQTAERGTCERKEQP